MVFPAFIVEGIGSPELLMILLVALLLFGSQRLPELARNFAKSIREFKKATSGIESEIKRAIEMPAPPPQPGPPVSSRLGPVPGAAAGHSRDPPPDPSAE